MKKRELLNELEPLVARKRKSWSGIELGRKNSGPNYMGDIEHFAVHDLRRTFRSQVSALGCSGAVGERAINHSFKGAEGIYDRYDYQKVADVIEPLVWRDSK